MNSENDTENARNPSYPEGPSLKNSDYDDPTSKIWSVYLSEAAKFDDELVESWTRDMDGILIFAGLFSASVTTFIVESYQDLSPNSGDTAVALLKQISQQIAAAANGSQANTFLPEEIFQPTSSTLRVNALWFMSLGLALSCALAATLVQQWARGYLKAIERRPAPHKKARIRAFLYEGVESFKMTAVVEGIPTVLHLSVFLFLLGLIDFLFPINHVIASVVIGMIVFGVLLYTVITILPSFYLHCPYNTPLSSICWRILQFFSIVRYYDPKKINLWGATVGGYTKIKGNMVHGRELLATSSHSKRDEQALMWTVESLTEDSELEPFVAGVSNALSDPRLEGHSQHTPEIMRRLLLGSDGVLVVRIVNLLETCLKPSSLAEARRYKRAIFCMDMIFSLILRLSKETHPRDLDTAVAANQRHWSQRFARTLILLRDDNTRKIASHASDTIKSLTAKLQNNVTAEGAWKRPGAIVMLHALGDFEFVTKSLGTMSTSIPIGDRRRTIHAFQTELIPHCLQEYVNSQNEPALEDQKHIVAYLNFAYASMGSLESYTSAASSIAWSLKALRSSKLPNIAQYANCAAARLALQLQFDFFSPGNHSDAKVPGPLNDLSVIENIHLQFNVDLPNCSGDRQWFVDSRSDSLTETVSKMPWDEMERLRTMDFASSRAIPIYDFGDPHRVILSQGRTAILITFLHSMATGLSEEVLALTLHTTRLITRGLTARFSSFDAQTLLVDLVGKVVNSLHDDIVFQDQTRSSNKYVDIEVVDRGVNTMVPAGIQPTHSTAPPHSNEHTDKDSKADTIEIVVLLLEMIGTIAHPDSISGAMNVAKKIGGYSTFDSVEALAVDTVRKLADKRPLTFTLDPPQDLPQVHVNWMIPNLKPSLIYT